MRTQAKEFRTCIIRATYCGLPPCEHYKFGLCVTTYTANILQNAQCAFRNVCTTQELSQIDVGK